MKLGIFDLEIYHFSDWPTDSMLAYFRKNLNDNTLFLMRIISNWITTSIFMFCIFFEVFVISLLTFILSCIFHNILIIFLFNSKNVAMIYWEIRRVIGSIKEGGLGCSLLDTIVSLTVFMLICIFLGNCKTRKYSLLWHNWRAVELLIESSSFSNLLGIIILFV